MQELEEHLQRGGFDLSSLSLSTSYHQTGRRGTVVIGRAKNAASLPSSATTPSPPALIVGEAPKLQPSFSWTSLFPELGTDWQSPPATSSSSSTVSSSSSATTARPLASSTLLSAPSSGRVGEGGGGSNGNSREGSFRSDRDLDGEEALIGVKLEPAAEVEETSPFSSPSSSSGVVPTAATTDSVAPALAPTTQQTPESRPQAQADREAARQRRRRRLMLRKPDSALALGLFEHYFKLEVRTTTTLPFLPHGEFNCRARGRRYKCRAAEAALWKGRRS